MKIGFIGLGNMGAPMAANLAKAGHDLTGFDMANIVVNGVNLASSAAEAAKEQDVVITMLPNGAILRSVAADVLPAMKKGAVLVDCSTVDVDSARAVAADAEAAGLLFVTPPFQEALAVPLRAPLLLWLAGHRKALQKQRCYLTLWGRKPCTAVTRAQAKQPKFATT